MNQVKELNRGLLNFYLSGLGIRKSELPLIGVRETKHGEYGEVKREYFAFTETSFGVVDAEGQDVQRMLTIALGDQRPCGYKGYKLNFYQEADISQVYRRLNFEEERDLQDLLE